MLNINYQTIFVCKYLTYYNNDNSLNQPYISGKSCATKFEAHKHEQSPYHQVLYGLGHSRLWQYQCNIVKNSPHLNCAP